jgi:hypothetical protein
MRTYHFSNGQYTAIPNPLPAAKDIDEALEEMGFAEIGDKFEDDYGFEVAVYHVPLDFVDKVRDEDASPLEASYVITVSLGHASQAVFVHDLVSLYQILD